MKTRSSTDRHATDGLYATLTWTRGQAFYVATRE